MSSTKDVTFVKDHKVQQHDGKGPHYQAGQSYTLEASYADKYVRKGYAEYVKPRQQQAQQRETDEQRAARLRDEQEARDREKLELRGKVEIPENFRQLEWQKLRALSLQVSDLKSPNQQEALAAIEAELKRREASAQ